MKNTSVASCWPSFSASQRLPLLLMVGPSAQPFMRMMFSATARMIWPVTCCDSSEASHATSGDDTDGSMRFHSSSGTSSASITAGAFGIVPVMRVA
ncbi:MAG: hypothetical protein ACTHN0_01980, partial [Aquihabitans sp.]